MSAGWDGEIGRAFNEEIELSFLVFIDSRHLLFLRTEGESLLYSISVSELFVVEAQSVCDLEQCAFSFVTVLLNP